MGGEGKGGGDAGIVDKLCQSAQFGRMSTMNISLPAQMKAFAEAQTRDGRYANVSDYMRDLIRRDQARQQAIAEIQAALDEGLASGPSEPFDMREFLASKRVG